jgi:hypothetical protein
LLIAIGAELPKVSAAEVLVKNVAGPVRADDLDGEWAPGHPPTDGNGRHSAGKTPPCGLAIGLAALP